MDLRQEDFLREINEVKDAEWSLMARLVVIALSLLVVSGFVSAIQRWF